MSCPVEVYDALTSNTFPNSALTIRNTSRSSPALRLAYNEAFSLYGPAAQTLLPQITSERVKAAMRILLPSLVRGLHGDERNVLLTLVRMLYTARTGQFTSKHRAALWAMALLSKPSADVLSYARSAYLGEVIDSWSERRIESVALADDLSQRISALLG